MRRLREAAFEERVKIHDIVLEGIGLAQAEAGMEGLRFEAKERAADGLVKTTK